MDVCLIAASSADVQQWVNFALSVGMVAAGLGFVIFVHELGHFLAAKACGVKAEKFYVGFDIPMPKILGFQIPSKIAKVQWGETEYGIGILPLGGYVKMLGQDDDPRKYKDEQERAKHDDTAAATLNPVEPIPDRPAFDPRSYQAKSVPQRMLIISAGVIMNLIFAVIMAAVAYSIGVPYVPTIVGSAPAGSSGWAQDLRPGDKVIRLSEGGRVSDQFRWEQDLVPEILLRNGRPINLLVQRPGVKNPIEVTVQGIKRPDSKYAMLGISSLGNTTIGAIATDPRLPVSKVKDLELGDKIVAIDGTKIDSAEQIQAIFAMHPGKTLKLSLERSKQENGADGKLAVTTTKHEVSLPPQPLRTLGLVMKLGPVSAVRENSPAKVPTEIKVGDELISIDGKPLGDPFTLSQRLLPYVGEKDVPIEIRRKGTDGKLVTITRKISPVAPIFMEAGADPVGGDQIGLEPLGIAAPVMFEIADVVEGSPAAKAGLKPGDTLEGVQFVSEDKEASEKLAKAKFGEQFTLDPEGRNWAFFFYAIQELPSTVDVNLTIRRDGKLLTKQLTPTDSTEGFYEPRGIMLGKLEEIRTAESAGEAVSLGFRETKEKLTEVARTLRAFVTGDISFRGAGGPIMIARVAYMEASKGWGRLLIFLTFLSANLALINFLPIPVLDGGHMVFLAAEGIRGKPVDENVQYYALLVGAAMLLCLMVFVFGNDIVSLVVGS